MSNITDRELLAICNLSNLKMEFANLTFIEPDTKILSNHTIYELLEKEENSINNNINYKKGRGFFKDLGENETDESELPEKVIYKDTTELKKEAGIVYEYYEKYGLGNKQGEFTDKWKVLYGADSYKLIADYLDNLQEKSNYVFTFETDGVLITLYKDLKTQEIKKIVDGEFFEDVSPEEKEVYSEFEKSYKEEKLYISREEIEEIKTKEKYWNYALSTVGIVLTFLPVLKETFKSIKGISTGNITVDGRTAEQFIKARYLKKGRISGINLNEKTIKNATKNYINKNKTTLIGAYRMRMSANYNVLSEFFNKGNLTSKMNEILRSSDNLTSMTLRMADILKNAEKNVIKSELDVSEKILEFLYKIKDEVYKNASFSNNLTKFYNNILVLIDTLENEKIFSTNLNMAEENFGIMLLQKENNLVICFKNNRNFTEADEKFKDKDVAHELSMMEIFNNVVLSKYLKNDTQITVTGFNFGAEIASLYYFLHKNIVKNMELKLFSGKELILLKDKFSFSPKDIGRIYNFDYKTTQESVIDSFNPINSTNGIDLLMFAILGITSISPITLLPFITMNLMSRFIINTLLVVNNFLEKYKYDDLYITLCKYGIFECKNKNNCEFNSNNCPVINGDTNIIKTISNDKLDVLLKTEVDFYFSYLKKNINLPLKEVLNFRFDSIFNNMQFENIDGIIRTKDMRSNYYSKDLSNEEIRKNPELLKETQGFYKFKVSIEEIYYYTLEEKNGKYSLKKYKKYKTQYYKINLENAEITDLKNIVSTPYEDNERIDYLIWLLKSFSEFNQKIEEDFQGKIAIARGVNLNPKIKVYKKLDDLLADLTQNQSIINYNANEFIFLPYIAENGNIKTRTTGEVSYLEVNEEYIGSVFRNIMEDKGASTTEEINYPKYETKEEANKKKLIENTEDWYYKKLGNSLYGKDIYLENSDEGIKLDIELIEKFDIYRENMKGSKAHICKGYIALDDVIKRIKQNPEILEKFYVLEKRKNTQNLIKELKIGHFDESMEKHDDTKFEYIYNDDDFMKRGIFILGCAVRKNTDAEIERNADKTPLLDGAVIFCDAGGSPKKFKVTSNYGYFINNKLVGLETDKMGGSNIPEFGSCAFKKGGCGCPATSGGEWTSKSSGMTVNGKKIITTSSTIKCSVGGTIAVQKNGAEITGKSVIK